MTATAAPGASLQELRERHRLQWLLYALALLMVALMVSIGALRHREEALAAERRDMARHAAAIESMIGRMTSTADSGMRLAIDQAAAHPDDPIALAGELSRVQTLLTAVRTLGLIDSAGRIVAASRPGLAGESVAHREFFTHARAVDDPSVVHVSEPYRTVLGVWTVNLVRSTRDASGAFGGIVVATLDPAALTALLESAVHHEGTAIALLHENGAQVMSTRGHRSRTPIASKHAPPESADAVPDEALQRTLRIHLSAGASATDSDLPGSVDSPDRMVHLRNVTLEGTETHGTLALALTRDIPAVLAPWRRGLALIGAASLTAAMLAAAALLALQQGDRRDRRRQEVADRAARAAAAEDDRQHALRRVASRIAQAGGWSYTPAQRTMRWADDLFILLGQPAQPEVSVDTLDALLTAGDAARMREALTRAAGLGEPFAIEVDSTLPGDRPRKLRIVGEPVRAADGTVTIVEGAVRDISDEAATLATLREREAQLRGMLDNAAAGMATLNVDGSNRRINRRYAEMLGWTAEELETTPAALLIHPDDLAAERADWAAMVAGTIDGYARDKRLRRKDGTWCWTHVALSTVRDADGRPVSVIVVVVDISSRKAAEDEQRRLEAELRQSQKLEAIGTLASGIAHDFNNLLGVMLGNAEVLRGRPGCTPADADAIDQIVKAGLIGRGVVERILNFSRRRPAGQSVIDLRDVVADATVLARAGIPASVDLVVDIPPRPVPVRAGPEQLQQALLNLVNNSVHAFGDRGGRIAVRLTAGSPDADARATLAVTDDGCGMDEATLSRIFDPFFTTKPVGEGTGLGMAMVRNIVTEHGGTVEVESRPGQGTTVTIALPVCVDAPPAPPPAADGAADGSGPVDGDGRRIAYLDDNRMMVSAARRLLERAGYRVHVFQRGSDLLDALESGDMGFDAVVTDFSMPEMSGLEVAQRVASLRPGTPVAIVSGFVSDELLQEARRLGVGMVLRKENSFQELVSSVGRLLARRDAEAAPR